MLSPEVSERQIANKGCQSGVLGCHGTCQLDIDPGRRLEYRRITALAPNVQTVRIAARNLCVRASVRVVWRGLVVGDVLTLTVGAFL
jgi:hypothetical protein